MAIGLRGVLHIATIAFVVATSAGAQGSKDYSIVIAEPLKFIYRERTALNTPCRDRRPIYGCTLFAEEQLSCSCQRDGNRWRLLANARFVPVMYLYVRRPDLVDHEQLHIDDVRARLVEYLESLTSRVYTTEAQCSQEARAASDEVSFVRRMNDFRRKSAEKLDPP